MQRIYVVQKKRRSKRVREYVNVRVCEYPAIKSALFLYLEYFPRIMQPTHATFSRLPNSPSFRSRYIENEKTSSTSSFSFYTSSPPPVRPSVRHRFTSRSLNKENAPCILGLNYRYDARHRRRILIVVSQINGILLGADARRWPRVRETTLSARYFGGDDNVTRSASTTSIHRQGCQVQILNSDVRSPRLTSLARSLARTLVR